MSVEYFIDTNLFIYQLEALDKCKGTIADRIIRREIESSAAYISFQVIQECLNTMLRKAEIPLTAEQTRSYKLSWGPCSAYPPVSCSTNGVLTSRRAIATAFTMLSSLP
ncbi:MAG: hypothetical protein ACU4EQ_08870 [Candidatus Nitrosoglobus sp.]